MSNIKFISKTLAMFSLTTALCAGHASALPPQIQNQTLVSTLAGNGGSSVVTGLNRTSSIGIASYIAVRPDGDLLVTNDTDILKIGNSPTGQISLFSGDTSTSGANSTNTLLGERYAEIQDIVYDPFGYAWLVDDNNENILRIDESDVDHDSDNVRVMYPTSSHLTELISDQFGNVYIADAQHVVIKKLSYSNPTYLPDLTSVSASIVAGASGTPGNVGGAPGTSRLEGPYGMAFSPDFTTLYFIDQGTGSIKALYPDNNTTSPYQNDYVQTLYTNSMVLGFVDLVVGPDGSIYASDQSSNNQIWKFAAPAAVGDTLSAPTVYAGSGTSGYLDGPALTAKFDIPVGMTVDSFGNIYVVDQENNRIRVISNVPDFTQFTTAIPPLGCNLPTIGTALNNIITTIVLSGDTSTTNGIYNNPTLAALQAVSLLSAADQAAFMSSLLPVHIPGMLAVTEFVNNKIFSMQNMRSQSIHNKYGSKSHAPASSHGGTSASYNDAPGGVWMEPMIAYLNRSADCCNVNQQAHIDGITVGVDYSVYEGIVLGWSGGKIIDRIHYDYRTQKEMIDTYFASPYASAAFFNQRAQIELAGIYARNLNKVSHVLTNGTIYHGKDQGNAWAGRAAASVKIVDERWIDLAPYAEVEYTSLQTGNHTQLPMDGLSFSVRRHTSAILRDEVGLMSSWRMGERGSSLTVSGKVGYVRKDQIQGDEIVLENSIIGDFQVRMKECPRNLVAVGAQLEYEVAPNASISASYEGEFGDGYYGQSYSASVGGKIRF